MNPLVSVIVVNHNRADLLEDCLSSLLEQTYHPFEILVVDNNSSDHSCAVVESFRDKRLRRIELKENRGFSGGNNAGIREASGEFVALLNNDAVADPQWIEVLVSEMRGRKQIGMCTSKVLFSRTNIIDKVGHLIYPDGQNRGRGTGEVDQGQYDQLEETFFADGCAALYRKIMLHELGGFDETFFAYGDDADLGIRGRWLGWKCLYVPKAQVYHYHSATSGRFSAQKVYWVERNRLWLAVKNYPLPLLVVSPLFTLYRLLWNLCAACLGRGAAGHFRKETSWTTLTMTLFRAYRDGVLGLREMLRKRNGIRRLKRISDLEFYRLLFRFRISARELSFQDLPKMIRPTLG